MHTPLFPQFHSRLRAGFSPLWLFLLLFAAQCRTQNAPLVLSGAIESATGWRPKAYLVYQGYYRQIMSPYEGVVVDSTDIDPNGHFEFRQGPWLKSKGLYLLFVQMQNSRYANDIAIPAHKENYICLVLSPGNPPIELKAKAAALSRTYQLVQADNETRLLAQLRDRREPVFQEFERQSTAQAAETDHTFVHGNAAEKQFDKTLEAFLDTTRSYYPALVAARYHTPDNEFRENPELFVALCARLRERAPDNPLTEQYCNYLSPDRLPVLKGELVPDYTLPSAAGDSLQLSQLKGRLILLDFWASWCAPCRKEIRETLRPLYDEYHARGFEIAGISIDSSPESWQNAIKKDGAIWPNVCDMLGDESPVRNDLKFVYIPGNYLMDGERRLLARNLHGEELRRFVEEYLK